MVLQVGQGAFQTVVQAFMRCPRRIRLRGRRTDGLLNRGQPLRGAPGIAGNVACSQIRRVACKILTTDASATGHHRQPDHHPLHFQQIAGPVVRAQGFQHIVAQHAGIESMQLQRTRRQRADVLHPFAQRRNIHGQELQPGQQGARELLLSHPLFQGRAGRRDHPYRAGRQRFSMSGRQPTHAM